MKNKKYSRECEDCGTVFDFTDKDIEIVKDTSRKFVNSTRHPTYGWSDFENDPNYRVIRTGFFSTHTTVYEKAYTDTYDVIEHTYKTVKCPICEEIQVIKEIKTEKIDTHIEHNSERITYQM